MTFEKVFRKKGRRKKKKKNKAYCDVGLYAYVYLLLATVACHLNKQVRLKLVRRIVPPSYVGFI